MAFTILHEPRMRWAWEVCWDGGQTICRADSEHDAKRIALALNESTRRTGLDDPLTPEEVAAVERACPR